MRRLSFISLILLVGAAAAPQRALAQAGTPPPTQTPAQPAAASPAAADDTSRSLFELTDRELFIGGRVTSIDGDPARFQRYQDVRDGLLFSGFRYLFAQPDGAYTFQRAREQRRLARSGVLRRLQPHRQAVGHRELAADPAVLQRRHDDALHGQRRHARPRRRDAAQRSRTGRPI